MPDRAAIVSGRHRRYFGGRTRAALAAASLTVLSGCVAAAIPVIAAGGLVQTQADGREPPRDPRPRVALPAEPEPSTAPADAQGPPRGAIVRDYTFADGSSVTVTNAVGAGVKALPTLPDRPSEAEPEAITLLAGATELPAPSAQPAAPDALPGTGAYAEFAAFARAQAAIPAAGAERRSAMLDDSTRLTAETEVCSIHPGAVLIDLDPAGGAFDEAAPPAGDPALAAALAELRREGVEIGWVSSRTADRAGAIRRALVSSGLDPDGRDQLVLLRLPEDSKQTRREDFARSHCVLAIAGDERADFDELFAYLRDPAAATPLDTLIGRGWFLVPTPLG